MHGLLNDCSRIERLAQEIYQQLAVADRFQTPVRDLFRRLADDEQDHVRQIEMAGKLPGDRLDAVSRIAGGKVAEALELAQRLRQDVFARPYGEEEALRLAVFLEKTFVRIHLDNALHFYDPRVIRLFEGLARSDEAHLETLRDGLTRWHAARR